MLCSYPEFFGDTNDVLSFSGSVSQSSLSSPFSYRQFESSGSVYDVHEVITDAFLLRGYRTLQRLDWLRTTRSDGSLPHIMSDSEKRLATTILSPCVKPLLG